MAPLAGCFGQKHKIPPDWRDFVEVFLASYGLSEFSEALD